MGLLQLGKHNAFLPLCYCSSNASRSPGYDNLDTLDTSHSLATLYMDQGKYDEAEKLLRRGLESYRKVFGPEHPYTQREMFGLSRCFAKGNYAEAEQLASTVLESSLRLLGPVVCQPQR